MSENPTDRPSNPPNPPQETNPPPEGNDGKPKKPPAQNGVKQPSASGWDFVQTPNLDKTEDVESSKNKK